MQTSAISDACPKVGWHDSPFLSAAVIDTDRSLTGPAPVVRGPVEIRHARIAHSRLARDASDHLPLVIDFHLNPVVRR
jgi:hypothetical protein